MPTEFGWFNPGRLLLSGFEGYAVLDASDTVDLATYSAKNLFKGLIYDDFTKWASSIRYYPFTVAREFSGGSTVYSKKNNWLQVGDNTLSGDNGVSAYEFPYTNTRTGYTLGQYYFTPDASYLGYDPYTKIMVWLPYYGYTMLKPDEVEGKFVNFLLYVDYSTGQGCYTIVASDTKIEYAGEPYIVYEQDALRQARIIGVYHCTIGADVTFGTTLTSDKVRNIGNTLFNTAASLAGSVIAGAPVAVQTSVFNTTQTSRTRNPQTNRLIKDSDYTESSSTVTTTQKTNDGAIISSLTNVVPAIFESFQTEPRMSISNSPQLFETQSSSVYIIFFKKRSPLMRDDASYKEYLHLYGAPLGKVMKLSNLEGYTEISQFRLVGPAFSILTDSERELLKSALRGGIILPDKE